MNSSASVTPITLALVRSKPQKITHDILVGKDVLELVTGAMYVEPLTIYREYIQNAADAIDEARSLGYYNDGAPPRVDISLDHAERTVRIRDNGAGVPNAAFAERLTAIGASPKRGQNQRGFRGVGRLAGLGYAQELVFRSRARGDTKIYELVWNGRRLRECLRQSDFIGDLAALVREATEVSIIQATGWPASFFEVELRKLPRVRNDLLMNPDEIRSYLMQVAPIPFAPAFRFKDRVEGFLAQHGIAPGICIHINGAAEPLYRPFRDSFKVSDTASDRIVDIELVSFPGIDGETEAVGYVLHHAYLGSIPRAAGIAGLRLRSGNIQVGGTGIVEELFTEQRFNGWSIGEVHVVGAQVIPNGRRDDFEINAHYQNLHGHLAALAARLSKQCREYSILRNRLRQANLIIQDANEHIALICRADTPPLVRQFFHDNVQTAIRKLELLSDQAGKLTDAHRALITKSSASLQSALDQTKVLRRQTKLSFLPERKQKSFVEFIQMMLQACDSPQSGAVLAKRILDHAKRSQK